MNQHKSIKPPLNHKGINSNQVFEFTPITSINYNDASPHDILDTIRKIVESSLSIKDSIFDVSMRNIENKLRKQYGGYISINTATSSSGKIFMYIVGTDISIRLYIRMINPPSLVNQSLRTISMALKTINDTQALEIPNKFKHMWTLHQVNIFG